MFDSVGPMQPLIYLMTYGIVILKELIIAPSVKKFAIVYPEIHYCIKNRPKPDPILIHLNQVPTPTHESHNTHFRTILPF